jgi:hypothetical protein
MHMTPPSLSTKRRIKRIAPLQLGKILGILYGLMGLIFIPFFMAMGALASQVPEEQRVGLMFMTGGFALFAPVMYAVMGFVFGVIGAAIYNLVAKWVGGVEVEIEQLESPPTTV